ncbi:hypothetical protein NQ314_011621 [Rhamnusium bicolor]|uniref:RNA-directed DNA polymerase n=1 Tax=Rhamnusium bicolor TaxID=1586634 RepID=A0AAV8XHV7_9CUCU|nr:hypothetical protein NQ314_011621 [Rhamnusium bicolor]
MRNRNNSSAKHCTNCNKPGHTLFNCRYNKNQNVRNRTSEDNVRHIQNSKNFPNQNTSNKPNTSFQNSNPTFQVTPNPEDIPKILQENHSNPTSGHSGFHRTYTRIKQVYKWNNMKKDVKYFIKQCVSCQKNKLVRKKYFMPIEITTTSTTPLEKIFLDIVGPLPLTENGNKFIITLQDDLTKYSQAYAVPNHETITIAQKFFENFICKFGIPNYIVTDQGKDFTSKLLSEVTKLFKIKQINRTAYHPQSNGALKEVTQHSQTT